MLKRLITLSGSLALAQIINFLVITLGTKLVGAEIFGKYSFVNSISLVLCVLFCLRGDNYILAKSNASLKRNLDYFVSISLVILAIVFLTLIIFSGVLFKGDNDVILIACGITLGFVNSNFNLLGSGLIKLDKLRSYTVSAIIKPLIMGGVLIVLYLTSPAFAYVMIASRLIAELVTTFLRYSNVYTVIKKRLRLRRKIIIFIKKNASFCLFGTLSSFLNIFSQQLPMIFLPIIYGYEKIGHFSLAFALTIVPMTLILSPMRNLLLKEYSDDHNHKTILKKYTLYLLPVSFLLIGVSFLLSDYFVALIWGSEWAETALFIKLMSLWVGTGLLNAPSFSLIVYQEKQRVLFFYELIFTIIKLSLVLASFFHNVGFNLTILMLVLIGVLYNIILIVYTIYKAN